jgi:hypothetical protein
MSNIKILKEEIENDTLGRGYGGMTLDEACQSIKLKNIPVYKPVIAQDVLTRSAVNGRRRRLKTCANGSDPIGVLSSDDFGSVLNAAGNYARYALINPEIQ